MNDVLSCSPRNSPMDAGEETAPRRETRVEAVADQLRKDPALLAWIESMITEGGAAARSLALYGDEGRRRKEERREERSSASAASVRPPSEVVIGPTSPSHIPPLSITEAWCFATFGNVPKKTV